MALHLLSLHGNKALKLLIKRYSEEKSEESERLTKIVFEELYGGSHALWHDLHDLWLIAHEVALCWLVLLQATRALGDKVLKAVCEQFDQETKRQISWLITRVKQAAPQTLVVAA